MCRFLLISSLLLVSCGPPIPAPPPPAPVTVTVGVPKQETVTEWDEFSGRLEAKESVEIRARVSGYLEALHFAEGKDVAAGDLLFTIDKRTYAAELDKAAADAERAASRAKLATSELERALELLGKRAVSQQDCEAKSASAAEAAAAVKSAAAAVQIARLNVEFTEIRSPISGRIGRALVTKGNLISGGANVTNATVLASIVSTDPIYCYIDVDEQASLRYRKLRQEGKRTSALDTTIPCEMALTDETGWPHQGQLDFVDNKLDPNTGTIRCRGVFKNEGRPLSPGFFARVRIPGSAPYAALLIPDAAISTDLSQKFVYVVGQDNEWKVRPVVLGGLSHGLRVIREGLQAGEKIIVNGQARLRPGLKISPQEAIP
jgi:RND family efflux transporter MFP subunit